jgi:hypothetical protein
MYGCAGLEYPSPKPQEPITPTGCNVPQCWHYIISFDPSGGMPKCICGSGRTDITGEVGCPGHDKDKVVVPKCAEEQQQPVKVKRKQ